MEFVQHSLHAINHQNVAADFSVITVSRHAITWEAIHPNWLHFSHNKTALDDDLYMRFLLMIAKMRMTLLKIVATGTLIFHVR